MAPKKALARKKTATRKTTARKTTARKVAARKPARRRPAATQTAAARTRPGTRPHFERSQPETLRLQDAAASLTVSDIERSLAFYRDVLGCIVQERWEQQGQLQGVQMLAGTVSIYLGQDDWKKGRDRKKGEGFRIYATTSQDVDRLATAIKARGGVLDQEPTDQTWGVRDFALTDPDGFKLTIAAQK